MRAPVVIPTGAWNHASQAAAICQKSPPSRPETGNHEYLPRPKTHSRSDIWQFFTDDRLDLWGDSSGRPMTFLAPLNMPDCLYVFTQLDRLRFVRHRLA